MSQYVPYATAALATGGVACSVYYIIQRYQQEKPVVLPKQWTQVGTLEHILLYPIKSCGTIHKDQAECTIMGLKDGWLRDRTLMVVDEKNNFITARGFPELLFVQPSIVGSELTLKHNDMGSITVNLDEIASLHKPDNFTVWGVSVPALDCGFAVRDWLTKLINKTGATYRLVYYSSNETRPFRRTHADSVFNFRQNDTGALIDEAPYNLINQASVDDLNSLLQETKVTFNNFRPNFLLKGGKPYEEDEWKFVKIGDNIFEIIKPCQRRQSESNELWHIFLGALFLFNTFLNLLTRLIQFNLLYLVFMRCVLTTIDQETGIRDSKMEPLNTLNKYRQIEDPKIRKTAGSAPRMGIQMALRSGPGNFVNVNDTIYVSY